MKKNIILIVFGLLITSLAFTQRPKHHDHPKSNPELKKEMQNYIEKNVVPVLQKKQAEFDSKLSKVDSDKISYIRIVRD